MTAPWWKTLQGYEDFSHRPVVIEVTPTCYAFCCTCCAAGPLRPTAAEAQQDADQHPTEEQP